MKRRAGLKRRSKSPRSRLIAGMVSLAKEIAKLRDDYTCVHCHRKVSGHNCQASHIVPIGRSRRLAYVPDNIDTMCYYCHQDWWHAYPTESGKWFADSFPERLARLKELEQTSGKRSLKIWELEEIRQKLLDELAKYRKLNQS